MKTLSIAFFIPLLWQALGTFPKVSTPLGEIEGIMSEVDGLPVKQFLGIPYATPPVGRLRFQKPEPMESWTYYTLLAKTLPSACMQYTEGPYPWYDDMPDKSEDCLYLNIFAPFCATEGSKLAVIFWIHGGGFSIGSNRMDVYDASAWAEREGVIVVTVNYRLGLFGFLTSDTIHAPGNMGLYDLVMALQWVNDYIEYFGGDQDRITIAGESAGAAAASSLCISPLTAGLFSRAILESASVTKRLYNSVDYNMALAERLAEAVGCAIQNFTIYDHPAEVVQCLRYIDATYLTKTVSSFSPMSMRSFQPRYGDTLLPNNGVEDVRNGNFHNVPILTGVLKDEGSIFVTMKYTKELGFFGEKDTKIDKSFATKMLKSVFGNFTDPQKYIDFYLKNVADDDYDLIRRQAYTAFGDLGIFCPVVYFAESYAKRNNDVYFYFFNHRPSKTPWAEWMGVAHFDEVQYVFGRPIRVPQDYNAAGILISTQAMKIWSNFAKNGNPGRLDPDVDLEWPKYSRENPTYLNMDSENFGRLDKGPHRESCDLMRSYYGF